MILKKWNYKTHKYDDYPIPEDWTCLVYCNDLEQKVNCPHCGELVKIGDTYTSLEIHTPMGLGYSVCKNCYMKELERRNNK